MNNTEKQAILTSLYNLNLDLINGHIDPLTGYKALREISDMAGDLMKAYKEQAIEEVQKHGGKYEDEMWTIAVQRSAGVWDFKGIAEWKKQKEALKKIEDDAKDAYKLFEKGKSVITTDGEVVQRASYMEGSDTIVFKKK